MKRIRGQESVEKALMENCRAIVRNLEQNPDLPNAYRRVYECKDCDKRYNSFQALGGHRASHKKVKLNSGDDGSMPKAKLHECKKCGMEFAIGQALGGHMRRHKDEIDWKKWPEQSSKAMVLFKKEGEGSEITEITKKNPELNAVERKQNNKGVKLFGKEIGVHNSMEEKLTENSDSVTMPVVKLLMVDYKPSEDFEEAVTPVSKPNLKNCDLNLIPDGNDFKNRDELTKNSFRNNVAFC